MVVLNKIREFLNGRLLSESLTYLECCYQCKHFIQKKCEKYDLIKYHQLLAAGFCENWYTAHANPAFEQDSRVKIFFPTRILACGGAERWLVDLATSLDPTKYCVAVGIENREKCDEILLKRLQEIDFLVFGHAEIRKYLDSADIVLSWAYTPRAKARVRILCSHGSDLLTEGIREEYCNTKDICRYKIAAVSEKGAEIWEGLEKGIPILWNGVDTDRLAVAKSREEVRYGLGISEDIILVGFLSRYIKEKHPERVYRACRRIKNAKAIFIGDVPPAEKQKDALYVGRTEYIGNLLNALDCFMLPSESEAFSLAIIEAWLVGTPVVTTSTGAIPELEATFGRLVIRSDEAVRDKDAILEAVYNSDEIVTNAKQVAQKYFTKQEMVKRWEQYLWETWVNYK